MYYVFESDIRMYHNQIMQAWPVGETAQYQMREPHWWWAEAWIPAPPPMAFAINSKAPLLDNYQTGTLFDLYSVKLLDILRKTNIKFETFPAEVIDRKTKQPLPVHYEVFHLLERIDAINTKSSKLPDEATLDHLHELDPLGENRDNDAAYWEAMRIGNIHVKKSIENTKKLMFRPNGQENLVLIHADLKAALDEAGITGCEYTLSTRFSSDVIDGKNPFELRP